MFTENYLFMRDFVETKNNALLRNLSNNFSEKMADLHSMHYIN